MSTILNKIASINLEAKRIAEEVKSILAATDISLEEENLATIKIALFGEFNSGKSTLVNALLGERIAAVGDAPETKVPHQYQWKGLEIVDLPGTDARDEEYREAKDTLKKTHAVLFVVSSVTGFDYESMWMELEQLYKSGTPLLVVINDKKAHQDDTAEQEFQNMLMEHFFNLANSKLPKMEWHNRIFWVNAKLAERGRLEGKELLIKRSGIVPLEHRLLDIVKESDAILRNLKHLRNLQERLQNLIDSLNNDLSSDETKNIKEKLEECKLLRKRLEAAANSSAEVFLPLKDIIATHLQKKAFIKGKQDLEIDEEMSSRISQTYDAAWDRFGRKFEALVQELLVSFGDKIGPEQIVWEKFFTKKSKNTEQASDSSYNAKEQINHSFLKLAFLMGALNPNLINQTMKSSAVMSEVIEDLFATVVDKGKDIFQNLASTSAGSAGTKVAQSVSRAGGQTAASAGKAAGSGFLKRVAGPLLIIGIAAWQMFRGFKEAEKERELRTVFMKESEAKAQLMVNALRDEFLTESLTYINNTMSFLERNLMEQIKSYNDSEKDKRLYLRRVHELYSRVTNIIHSLAYAQSE